MWASLAHPLLAPPSATTLLALAALVLVLAAIAVWAGAATAPAPPRRSAAEEGFQVAASTPEATVALFSSSDKLLTLVAGSSDLYLHPTTGNLVYRAGAGATSLTLIERSGAFSTYTSAGDIPSAKRDAALARGTHAPLPQILPNENAPAYAVFVFPQDAATYYVVAALTAAAGGAAASFRVVSAALLVPGDHVYLQSFGASDTASNSAVPPDALDLSVPKLYNNSSNLTEALYYTRSATLTNVYRYLTQLSPYVKIDPIAGNLVMQTSVPNTTTVGGSTKPLPVMIGNSMSTSSLSVLTRDGTLQTRTQADATPYTDWAISLANVATPHVYAVASPQENATAVVFAHGQTAFFALVAPLANKTYPKCAYAGYTWNNNQPQLMGWTETPALKTDDSAAKTEDSAKKTDDGAKKGDDSDAEKTAADLQKAPDADFVKRVIVALLSTPGATKTALGYTTPVAPAACTPAATAQQAPSSGSPRVVPATKTKAVSGSPRAAPAPRPRPASGGLALPRVSVSGALGALQGEVQQIAGNIDQSTRDLLPAASLPNLGAGVAAGAAGLLPSGGGSGDFSSGADPQDSDLVARSDYARARAADVRGAARAWSAPTPAATSAPAAGPAPRRAHSTARPILADVRWASAR